MLFLVCTGWIVLDLECFVRTVVLVSLPMSLLVVSPVLLLLLLLMFLLLWSCNHLLWVDLQNVGRGGQRCGIGTIYVHYSLGAWHLLLLLIVFLVVLVVDGKRVKSGKSLFYSI